jgi:hypothetical protein
MSVPPPAPPYHYPCQPQREKGGCRTAAAVVGNIGSTTAARPLRIYSSPNEVFFWSQRGGRVRGSFRAIEVVGLHSATATQQLKGTEAAAAPCVGEPKIGPPPRLPHPRGISAYLPGPRGPNFQAVGCDKSGRSGRTVARPGWCVCVRRGFIYFNLAPPYLVTVPLV